MLGLLSVILMAQVVGGPDPETDGVIRPRLYRCTTQCSVILAPSGSDDTASIQAALDNPAYSTVCLSTGTGQSFQLTSPLVMRSGKTLTSYRNPALIALPPYRSRTDPGFSTAIVIPDGTSSAAVSCLWIDGGFPSSCVPSTHPKSPDLSYNALVLVGSDVKNSSVSTSTIQNPAGWTALQWTYRGEGNSITSNTISGAGFNWSNGVSNYESDGISAWGDNITIQNNVVIDATDQMLVAWGASPTISGNKAYAVQRYAYGAFAFNDIPSYSGITVQNNQVFVEGGTIGVAFAFGSALWQCGHCFLSNFANATVSNNQVHFNSGSLGYAFAVNGAKNLTIDSTNTVDGLSSFSTAQQGCGVSQKWIGGKFLFGSQLGSDTACGGTLSLGCQNCSLLGGPWTAVDERNGHQLIGPFPRPVPPPCGY